MVRNEKGLLQFDEKDVDRWRMAADEPQRTEEMTHSEKLADQVVQDVGRLDATGRKRVRGELDRIEAPLTGRAAQDAAAGQAISGRYRGLPPVPFADQPPDPLAELYQWVRFLPDPPPICKAMSGGQLEKGLPPLPPIGSLASLGLLTDPKVRAIIDKAMLNANPAYLVKLNCAPVALSETTEISCPEHGSFVVEENGGRHCAFLGCTWTWRKVEPPAASDYAFINMRQKQIEANGE